jgi:hypothetical protein
MSEPISGEKSAFPWPKDQNQHLFSLGVNLRDYFAAAALEKASRGSDRSADEIAKRAFYIADAMLKAREAKP